MPDKLPEASKEQTKTIFLTVEVRDNGHGIEPEKQFLLFKPFSQVSSEISRTAMGGTGLGLAVTKAVIDSMQGQVRCISEGRGKGCIFRLEVPALWPS